MPAYNPVTSIFKYLRDSGDSNDMAVDGSATPVEFFYQAPANKYVRLARMNLHILDAGIAPDQFAGISELTNGCLLELIDGSDVTIVDVLDGEPITRHIQLVSLAGVDVQIVSGTPVDAVICRWTLHESTAGFAVQLPPSGKIQFTVRDDLTAISEFKVMMQGYVDPFTVDP